MKDNHGREITYIRISVTDRCNLRCQYCMPAEGVSKKKHENIISFEEIEKAVTAAAALGISKFRITGGEPLIRKDIVMLIQKLSSLKGVGELVMTTNGRLLKAYAKELKEAGLQRVNVSIDSMREDRYALITRGGMLSEVWEGIEAAKKYGLSPKLNVVMMKGFNDDEILPFARLTLDEPLDVRFIELMPVGEGLQCAYTFMPVSEAKAKLSALNAFESDSATGFESDPAAGADNGEVAQYDQIPGAKGRIGWISPISAHFCKNCNKIRLTSDGKLKTCLHSDVEWDMREVLRCGNIEAVQEALAAAICQKEERHLLGEGAQPVTRSMNRIGG